MSDYRIAAQQKNLKIRQHQKCSHPKLIFIGMQETGIGGKFIPLFNCQICKTTVAVEDVKNTG